MFYWLKELKSSEKRALGAAYGGYAVDAFDYMVYPFIIPTLMAIWMMDKGQAGMIATATLLSSALGGWLAGILADRYGRVRVLQWTILVFAVFTFLSGMTNSYWQLLITRSLQGLGFGGEWSVGSVLIAEMIRPRHRGKAVGLVQSSWSVGWGLAALTYTGIYALVPEEWAWRILFWLGILPAVLIVFIRRYVKEPEVYLETRKRVEAGEESGHFLDIFKPAILRTTLLASLVATGMQGGYYGITTWLPTFLKTERNLSVFNTGGYLFIIIMGSFFGYLTGAYLSDRIGRRKCFILFAVASMTLVTLYTRLPITDTAMLFLGFPLGFFVSGIFSGMGAFLSELFPNAIRGSGQGFCYNVGRGIGAFFPAVIGYLSAQMGLGIAVGIFAGGAYLLVIIGVLLLPETRGRVLSDKVASSQDSLAQQEN